MIADLFIAEKSISTDEEKCEGSSTSIASEERCGSLFRENKKYSHFYAWSYVLLQASVGLYFGYALTCMNNLGGPIIEGGLNLHNMEFTNVLADQNLYFGLGKVIMSVLTGALADKYGRRN